MNLFWLADWQEPVNITHVTISFLDLPTDSYVRDTFAPVADVIQAGGFLRPDCAPSCERPQFRMPTVRNAPELDRSTTPRRRFNYNIPPSVLLLQQCHYRNRRRAKLQNVSPPSVLFESSQNFFTIHRRHRRKKWWTRILKFEFCDFWELFEIFKKASRGPSAAVWTIMVAAKLDQSRVLVTTFRQNRLMLKGRSAGPRHTDRHTHRQTDSQTNSAENNGPSGLQSGQKQVIWMWKTC